MNISIIAVLTRNRIIGRDGTMPWRLPADLQRFKQITMGKSMLMGRKTFESLGRVLPGRRHIILTRDRDYRHEGCDVVHSIGEATELLRNELEVMVIGGADLYRQTLPLAERLYLTLIDAELDGDVSFPEHSQDEWRETERVERAADERNAYALSFVVLERVAKKTPAKVPG